MTYFRATITTLSGYPMSELWTLHFSNGAVVHIESGHGVRQLAAAFDASEGFGDLVDKIAGQEIIYSTDAVGVLEAFTPIAEWEGPDIPDDPETRMSGVTVDEETGQVIDE